MTTELSRDEYPFAFAFENLLFQARQRVLNDESRFLSNREFSRMLNEFLPEEHQVNKAGVEVGRWLKGKSVPTFERCAAIQLVFRSKFDLEFDLDVLWAFAVFQFMTPDHIRGMIKWMDLKSPG